MRRNLTQYLCAHAGRKLVALILCATGVVSQAVATEKNPAAELTVHVYNLANVSQPALTWAAA